MKRFLILLMLLLGMILSGCGKEAAEPPEEDVEDAVEPAPVVEKFTVTFDSKGGSAIPSQTVEKGNKVKKPDAPVKDCGCEFVGWYVGDEKWSFIGYVVTENITLTAKWVDCFGMNEKERDILESMLAKNEYTWSDIESIECTEINEGIVRYSITLKNGAVKSIDVAREYVK